MNWNFRDFVRKRLSGYGLALFTILFLVGCGANSAPSSETKSSSQSAHGDHAAGASPTPRIPAHFSSVDEARPLPAVLDPKRFSDPVVARVYHHARENPEVFSQQPCYCYCDAGEKHRSLLDCFATEHGAT